MNTKTINELLSAEVIRRIYCKRKSGNPSETKQAAKNGAKVILVITADAQDHMKFLLIRLSKQTTALDSSRALQKQR